MSPHAAALLALAAMLAGGVVLVSDGSSVTQADMELPSYALPSEWDMPLRIGDISRVAEPLPGYVSPFMLAHRARKPVRLPDSYG